MIRPTAVAVCASLLASACKIERTPPEYIDHRAPIAATRGAAAEELQDRLSAIGQALNRGDSDEALRALAPTPDAYMIAPGREAVLTGEEIAGTLAELASLPSPLELRNVVITVGPRANVAWFRAEMHYPGADSGSSFRFSGLYLRGDEGEWRLVQGHLSTATAPARSLSPDSLPSSPGAAEAPPGDG